MLKLEKIAKFNFFEQFFLDFYQIHFDFYLFGNVPSSY
ncbi:hypothetical protein J550_1117 [Acinetobacter sp. 230853]|nr:hypothetical protein J546_0820 [Acinetobacter sp. 1461402]EXB73189.1 hypothetical protein J550_1117 [Acinetobacter sp. 230853]